MLTTHFQSISFTNILNFLIISILTGIVILWGCQTIYPQPANPADEDGNPPIFTFLVTGPGGSFTLHSDQSCPPEGVINNFDTVFLQLPAVREYGFTFSVTDFGGVTQIRFGSNDSTIIDFEITNLDNTFILRSSDYATKTAVLSGGSTLMTSLILNGQLFTKDTRDRGSIFFEGFDAGSNHIFRTLTAIVAPDYIPDLVYEGDCR